MKNPVLALSACVLVLGASAGAAFANPSTVAPGADPCAAQADAPQADKKDAASASKKRSAKRAGAQQAAATGDPAICPLEGSGAVDRDIIRRKV